MNVAVRDESRDSRWVPDSSDSDSDASEHLENLHPENHDILLDEERIIREFFARLNAEAEGSLEPRRHRRYAGREVVVTYTETKAIIGRNGTEVPRILLEDAHLWSSYTKATRKLMYAVFTKKELATHSLSGNVCPARKVTGAKPKPILDPGKVEDVVNLVCYRTDHEPTHVRRVITNICGDCSKISRNKNRTRR